jgi:hypothetical protein
MSRRMRICRIEVLFGSILTGTLVVAAFAQDLSADAIAKAKAFKEADVSYVHALCDGSRSNRDAARTARKQIEDDLEKLIADMATQAPDVQKALDAAADAGEAADKIAASSSASDRDKSNAHDKFESAKANLRDAVARERSRIEAQISKDFSVKFEPASGCPDQPKAAGHQRSPSAKAAHARSENVVHATQQNPPASAPAALPLGVGIGPGGFGIIIGR